MIRPLYRWKSFWFGVLVIAFLGWAWGSAMDRASMLVVHKSRYGISAGAGTFGVYRLESGLFEGGLSHGDPGAFPLFPPFAERKVEGTWTAFLVAHWFLILLFLVPWSGWLAWRWRRVGKLAAEQV